jgi:guanylate kinase
LERRLRGRGTEPPDVVARRLDQARIELAAESEFDAAILSTSAAQAAAELVTLMNPREPDGGGD